MAFVYTGENVTDTPTYKIPPEGDYVVAIIQGEEAISKSGKDMLKFRLKLQHPEFKNELYYFIVQGEYAQQNIHDMMQSCGLTPVKGAAINAQSFIGNVGKIRLKHELYNGETQIQVKRWLKPNTPENILPQGVDPTFGPAKRNPDDIPF